MRLLLAAALAAVTLSASAQDALLAEPRPALEISGESVVLAVPAADERVAPAPEATPAPAPERRNVVSGVLGGEGFAAGVGYERSLSGRFLARTGLQYYNNGTDIQGLFVPATAGLQARLGGRWSADASGGVTVALMNEDAQAVPEFGVEAVSETYVRVRPVLGVGVRYETNRLHLRGGAALFPARFDRIAVEDATWSVLPWPSVSAGYRF